MSIKALMKKVLIVLSLAGSIFLSCKNIAARTEPFKFDADEWTELFKRAGAHYE